MLRSDARSNIIGALVFAATRKVREVCVFFNHKLIRGNRAVKFSADSREGFISPNYPLLAKDQLHLRRRCLVQRKTHIYFMDFNSFRGSHTLEFSYRRRIQSSGAALLRRGFAADIPNNNRRMGKQGDCSDKGLTQKFRKFRSKKYWRSLCKGPFYKHSVPGTSHQTIKVCSTP